MSISMRRHNYGIFVEFVTKFQNIFVSTGVQLNSIDLFFESTRCKGPFKCYVTQMGVGGGGCLIFWKKALRRCNVQCY